MNKVFKDVLKSGGVMFVVGALLALAAAPLANLLGGADVLGAQTYEHAVTTPVLWTGAFFGAFGAIHAAVAPAAEFVFGKEKEKSEAVSPAPEKSQVPQVNITIQQTAPSMEQSQVADSFKWRTKIAAERATPAIETNAPQV